jgi:hypothetical protein
VVRRDVRHARRLHWQRHTEPRNIYIGRKAAGAPPHEQPKHQEIERRKKARPCCGRCADRIAARAFRCDRPGSVALLGNACAVDAAEEGRAEQLARHRLRPARSASLAAIFRTVTAGLRTLSCDFAYRYCDYPHPYCDYPYPYCDYPYPCCDYP